MLLHWMVVFVIAFMAAYWCTSLVRARRALKALKPVDGSPRLATDEPQVTVVVPAHNEADVIGRCVRSLIGQDYSNLQIVVVLDRCTDETESRLRDAAGDTTSLHVMSLTECPPDWSGKCYALARGAEAAAADPTSYILFTDADVEFHPSLVRAAVSAARAENAQLLTLVGTLESQTWFERVVQPVCAFELMRSYPPDAINRPGSKRGFANGQFLLFERGFYDSLGGHAAVRDDLLEDLSFARLTVAKGGRVRLLRDAGLMRVAMYRGSERFTVGWTRILLESCRRRPPRMLKHAARNLLTGPGEFVVKCLALILIALTISSGVSNHSIIWASVAGGLLVLATLFKILTLTPVYAHSSSPIYDVFSFPLGSLIVATMLARGRRWLLDGKSIRWAGREYRLSPRYE